MSDEQKKPTGPLPGAGKPAAGPLPGAAKPGAGKPGAALPGLGAAKAGRLGHAAKPAAPKGPSIEQIRRDPFATSTAAPAVDPFGVSAPMITPGADARISIPPPPVVTKLTQRQKLVGVLVTVGLIVIGFVVGSMVAGRVEDAIMIRDARIVQYEIDKLAKLFSEVDAVLTKAYQDAQANKFDKSYLGVLNDKLQGNPFNPSIFTDRNYKNFDAATVDALTNYYDQWTTLYADLGTHFRATENDEPELSATGEEFARLQEPTYGVVFARDEEGNGQLIGNLVVLGKIEEKDGKIAAQIQYEVGTYGDQRTLYNGAPGDAEFSKNAEAYVIAVEPQKDGGLLKSASDAHFPRYQARLKAITELLAKMRAAQATVKGAIDKVASESAPSFLTGMDVDEDVEEYKAGAEKAAAGIAEEPAAGAPAEKPAE